MSERDAVLGVGFEGFLQEFWSKHPYIHTSLSSSEALEIREVLREAFDAGAAADIVARRVDHEITREFGDLVTFRVICPSCGWRHSWEQYEREPAKFDGLCYECGTRCNGDSPAVVRA